jgi:hypothetical protein
MSDKVDIHNEALQEISNVIGSLQIMIDSSLEVAEDIGDTYDKEFTMYLVENFYDYCKRLEIYKYIFKKLTNKDYEDYIT